MSSIGTESITICFGNNYLSLTLLYIHTHIPPTLTRKQQLRFQHLERYFKTLSSVDPSERLISAYGATEYKKDAVQPL